LKHFISLIKISPARSALGAHHSTTHTALADAQIVPAVVDAVEAAARSHFRSKLRSTNNRQRNDFFFSCQARQHCSCLGLLSLGNGCTTETLHRDDRCPVQKKPKRLSACCRKTNTGIRTQSHLEDAKGAQNPFSSPAGRFQTGRTQQSLPTGPTSHRGSPTFSFSFQHFHLVHLLQWLNAPQSLTHRLGITIAQC